MFNEYPYTDFHELNLDWVLKTMQQLKGNIESRLPVDDDSITERKLSPEVRKKLNETQELAYTTPEEFGAVGDGVVDDTEALVQAIAEASASTKILYMTKKYKIFEDIDLPKNVAMIGQPATRGEIVSDHNAVYVRGGGDNEFIGCIKNVKFIGVTLVLGESTNDFGNQYLIDNCRFGGYNSGVGLRLHNNTWNMLINNCKFRNLDRCIFIDFVGAVNSGAAIKIVNTTAYDAGYGLYLDGATTDGSDIQLVNCNLEHNDVGLYASGSTSGNHVYLVNTHYESNRLNCIKTEAAAVWQDGGWAFAPGDTTNFDSLFYASGSSYISISNMRLNSGANKYYHTENNASIIVNAPTVIAPAASFYNNGFAGTKNVYVERFKIHEEYQGSKRIDLQTSKLSCHAEAWVHVPGGSTSTEPIVVTVDGFNMSYDIVSPLSNVGGFVAINIDVVKNRYAKATFTSMVDGSTKTSYIKLNTSYPDSALTISDTNGNKSYTVDYEIYNLPQK